MIGVVDIEIQAHSPQFPLDRLVSFAGSPQSVRVRNVPRQIGSWRITRVYTKATYPDGTEAAAELKLVGGVWIGTFAGSAVAGSTSKGFTVYADGIDENGGEVSGYVLGVGDVDVLTDDGRTLPQEPLKVVNIVTEKPSSPHVGDAIWNSAGDLEIWDGSEWRTVGGGGAVESVNGKTGAVVLTGAHITTSADDEETIAEKLAKKADEFTEWELDDEVLQFNVLPTFDGADQWYCSIQDPSGNSNDCFAQGGCDATTLGFAGGEIVLAWATRKRVLYTGDADKLTPEQKDILDGGPYLPSTNPNFSGSLSSTARVLNPDAPDETVVDIACRNGRAEYENFGSFLSVKTRDATEDEKQAIPPHFSEDLKIVEYNSGGVFDYDALGHLRVASIYDIGNTHRLSAFNLFDIKWNKPDDGEAVPYVSFTLESAYDSWGVAGKNKVDFGYESVIQAGPSIKKQDKEVATEDQLRVTMQLVGNDPYTVQLDGETLTFAEIKTYAQTRNAVIQRGQGTYRVTYIGASEMMWDVTGTVQGEVKTGQIHIFDQDGVTVVQRVDPKVIATRNYVDGRISATDDGFKSAVESIFDNGETEAF